MARKQIKRSQMRAPVFKEPVMRGILDDLGRPTFNEDGTEALEPALDSDGNQRYRYLPGAMKDGELVRATLMPSMTCTRVHVEIRAKHTPGIRGAREALEAASVDGKPAAQAQVDKLMQDMQRELDSTEDEFILQVPDVCSHCDGTAQVRKFSKMQAQQGTKDERRAKRRAKMTCPSCNGNPTNKPAGWRHA